MKKKKLLCLTFVLAVIFTFAACDNQSQNSADKGADDLDAFMEVQKNMSNMKDAEYKINIEKELPEEAGGSTSLSGTAKQVNKSKDDFQLAVDYVTNYGGADVRVFGYMKDQTLYMNMMGKKLKISDKDQINAVINSISNNIYTITKEMISDLKVEQQGSSTIYHVKLVPEKTLDYLSKNTGANLNLEDIQNTGITIDTYEFTVVAGNDKMAKSVSLVLSLSAEADGERFDIASTLSMEYLSINSGLKINFPDFREYKEMKL